jgi:serine/threonine protein kinase
MLNNGDKFGPYEIVSPLGAGGMGEVYRARDTRLDRTVAIKVLPSHLSSNTELKQRFEREARAISSLNHPHICQLFDVGSQDGTSFLVMEFLDGESLDRRLQKGALPLKQALEYGSQICDALEKAHRAGIVHRDLKPGNIVLTPSGAKLLDFGLAKLAQGQHSLAAAAADPLTPATPTMNLTALSAPAAALTQQGSVVGTFQYMAPEVLRGQDADARSDIFSLGCVLYEMVTGRHAFEGRSQLSVMTAILEKDPDPITNAQPASSAALDYAIRTCLEKNPDDRFQTAHDVRLQLAWIGKAGSQTAIPAVEAKPKPKFNVLWAAALGLLGLGTIALALALWSSKGEPRVLRTNILPPDGAIFETLYRNGPPALSPDGSRVAFIAKKDDKSSLWVRALDKLDSTPLPGTEEAYFPFWSPDGANVAFFMRGKLWREDLAGGSPIAICDAPEARGGTWGKSGVILFAPRIAGPLSQVPATGGTPKAVTQTALTASSVSDRWPFFLPDGNHFLYLHSPQGSADDHNEVHFGSLNGADQLLMQGRFYTMQYGSGWLLAVRDGSLEVWKFDPASGKITGEAVQLVDRIASEDITSGAVFSASMNGDLLYQQGAGGNGDRHVWFDASGKQLGQLSTPSVYGPLRLSPDGTRIGTPVWVSTGRSPLWIWDLVGGTRAPASDSQEMADTLVWSPDGRTIYFDLIHGDGKAETRQLATDGSQPERPLIKSDKSTVPVDVTADGKWLLYEETSDGFSAVLKAFPLQFGLESFTVTDGISGVSNARLKPQTNDWLAYQTNQSGRDEIYLTRFPHPGSRYQISQAGGTQAVWSRDGKTLYYLDPSRKLIAVGVEVSGDTVKLGTPRELFQTGIRHSINQGGYDVTGDGRFLMVNSITESTAPVVLVTNWDKELKK